MRALVGITSLVGEGTAPRYEQIANAVCQAIRSGHLKPGDRLPTVRALASELGVSLTTVTAAFRFLAEHGWTRGEIGRGTFVAERRASVSATSLIAVPSVRGRPRVENPWRKRAIVSLMERLRSSFPMAANCSFGGPGPSLLPLKLIKHHWLAAFNDVTNWDLQYKTVDPIEALIDVMVPRLVADNIPVKSGDLLVGTSAQQFMILATDMITRLGNSPEPVVGVEQPGYYTIFDAWDHRRVRMIGIETDENGVLPESVDSAIVNGANAILLTPRAHNPTGSSWTPGRLQALADVLSRHPHVLAIEDDHFADLSEGRTGSLLADSRVEDRVIYIRSFSKSIAPDLRLALAAARPPLKTLLEEAKSHADGWTSRLLQRVLAGIFQDDRLAPWLDRVRSTYQTRRERVAEVIEHFGIPGVVLWPASDGVNLWIQLPSGFDAAEVIERAAALGVLIAPGEVFYLSPGHSDVVRFNVGSIETEQVSSRAESLVKAIQLSGGSRSTAICV